MIELLNRALLQRFQPALQSGSESFRIDNERIKAIQEIRLNMTKGETEGMIEKALKNLRIRK